MGMEKCLLGEVIDLVLREGRYYLYFCKLNMTCSTLQAFSALVFKILAFNPYLDYFWYCLKYTLITFLNKIPVPQSSFVMSFR